MKILPFLAKTLDYSQCESMVEARRIEPGFYLKPLGLWAEASFLNMKFS